MYMYTVLHCQPCTCICSPIQCHVPDCTTLSNQPTNIRQTATNESIKFDEYEMAKRTLYFICYRINKRFPTGLFWFCYFNVLVSAYQTLVSTLLIFSSPRVYCLDFLSTTSFHRRQLPRNLSDLRYSWDPRGSGSERLKASSWQPSSQRTDRTGSRSAPLLLWCKRLRF